MDRGLIAAASSRALAAATQHGELLENYYARTGQTAGPALSARFARSAGLYGRPAPAGPDQQRLREWITPRRGALHATLAAVETAGPPARAEPLSASELDQRLQEVLAAAVPSARVRRTASGRVALGALMAAADPAMETVRQLGVPLEQWPTVLETALRRVATWKSRTRWPTAPRPTTTDQATNHRTRGVCARRHLARLRADEAWSRDTPRRARRQITV